MPTRLKRPAFWRHLAVTAALVAFQGYLGYSVVTGQFGIESREVLQAELDDLEARSAALQAEIDSYRHRVELFRSNRLDPDIVTERARALLSMAGPDDIVVMVDPDSGEPLSRSDATITDDQLSPIIEVGID